MTAGRAAGGFVAVIALAAVGIALAVVLADPGPADPAPQEATSTSTSSSPPVTTTTTAPTSTAATTTTTDPTTTTTAPTTTTTDPVPALCSNARDATGRYVAAFEAAAEIGAEYGLTDTYSASDAAAAHLAADIAHSRAVFAWRAVSLAASEGYRGTPPPGCTAVDADGNAAEIEAYWALFLTVCRNIDWPVEC